MIRQAIVAAASWGLLTAPLHAQNAQPPIREDALDPSPVDPAVDVGVPMFIGNAADAAPRIVFGNLVMRDMLTPLASGDPLRPSTPGAVLQYMKAVSQASLAPGQTASGRAPAGDRMVFYTASGIGFDPGQRPGSRGARRHRLHARPRFRLRAQQQWRHAPGVLRALGNAARRFRADGRRRGDGSLRQRSPRGCALGAYLQRWAERLQPVHDRTAHDAATAQPSQRGGVDRGQGHVGADAGQVHGRNGTRAGPIAFRPPGW